MTKKSFLKRDYGSSYTEANRYLKDKLGDYLSAREIYNRTKIKTRTLNKWTKQGLIQSVQLKGRWYYSIRDIMAAIKTADIKDIR